MNLEKKIFVWSLGLILFGCGSEEGAPGDGSGGAPPEGSGGSGGAPINPSSGGAASGGAATGGVSAGDGGTDPGTGGADASGGASITGGASSGGTDSGGSGGADSGGSGGTGSGGDPATGGGGNEPVHPDDAVEFEGHWYRFTQASIGGAEAQVECEALGGYLACIESQPEDAFIFSLAGTARPWFGMNNEADINNYVWVNGSPVTFEHWAPGQPDYPATERWVKMQEDGTWDDGNIASSYICEWEE
jgi:hypothetical protein